MESIQLTELYQQLSNQYPTLEPHAETWDLWVKPNKKPSEIFEVAIGTILVQNTNWRNVNQAISNLKQAGITSFEQLHNVDPILLKELIKPAGFYNQHSVYLQGLSNLYLTYNVQGIFPSRQQLLACKGIGKETADSILVYCFQRPVPVVGTYTRRVLARIYGDVTYLKSSYETIQNEQYSELPNEFEVFGRFHALIVCHSQNYCQKNKPKCVDCILSEKCMYGKNHETNLTIAHIQNAISPPKRKNPPD